MPNLIPSSWMVEERSIFRLEPSSLFLDDGNGFDFHEKLRPEKAGDFYSGAGGRILDVHVLVANFAEIRQVGQIDGVTVQLDHVVECSARGFQRRLKVFKNLLDLRAEVVLSNEVARLVERNLTRDKDDGPAVYRCELRVANGFGHGI